MQKYNYVICEANLGPIVHVTMAEGMHPLRGLARLRVSYPIFILPLAL